MLHCGESGIRFFPVSHQPATRHHFELPASAINKLSVGETNVLWWRKCFHCQVQTSSHFVIYHFFHPVFLVISMANLKIGLRKNKKEASSVKALKRSRARSHNDKRIFLWHRQRPSSGHIRQHQTDKYKYKCAWRPIILDVKQAYLGLWPPALRHPHTHKHRRWCCFKVCWFF